MSCFVDHIIIAVKDLPKATQAYRLMLGRAPSWQGTHPDYGSANTLFRLDNTYLELLASISTGWAGDMVRQHVAAKGESLAGLIFGTPSTEDFVAHARGAGLRVSDPTPGHGIDTSSGATRKWRTMFWERTQARGIFSFAIQHDDPDALPMALVEGTGPVEEPTKEQVEGSITGVDHVVVNTNNAAAAKNFYGRQLGVRLALEQSRPEWGADMLFFRCNSMSIEVVASDKHVSDTDILWGMALKTADIEATHARLNAAGVRISKIREGRKPDTRVCTVKSHCLDVPTLLIGPC